MKVAIVGAGVSGLSLAYFLLTQNPKLKVTLFEKSRGVGGRMAMRRRGHGIAIDTGCQYLSFDQSEILDFLLRTVKSESIKSLPQPILCLPDGWVVEPKDRFYFPEGMTFWCKNIVEHLQKISSDFTLKLETPIQNCKQLSQEGYDQIFMTLPGFQAVEMGAQNAPEYQSCLSIAFTWNSPPRQALDHFAYRDLSQREGITWLAHEGMKRGHPEIWVAQVSSSKAQELSKASGQEHLIDDFLRNDIEQWIPGFEAGEKTLLDAKYWKYAFPVSFVDPAEQKGFEKVLLADVLQPVYFLGDGYLGVGRVENAIQSALMTAQDFFKNVSS